VMELCQREGLYQIDLLNGRKERITEREYWAQRRGQRELDRQMATRIPTDKPKATKYETTKAILRKNIRAALASATNLDEFSTILLQEYGIELRESRGRFSYLPPDRTKSITARMLGDDFSKEAVLAVLDANRVCGVSKAAQDKRKPISFRPKSKSADSLQKLIDIQAKLAAGKGAGYERWAKVFNLKQLSKTLLFLQEHGIQSEAELNSAIGKADTAVSETTAVIKDLEQRIAANRELQTQVVNYHRGHGVAAQAKGVKNPAAFREEHRAELLPYEAACKYFKVQGIKTLPSIKKLQTEREELISEKNTFYQKYLQERDTLRQLQLAEANVKEFLRKDEQVKDYQQPTL